MDMEIGNLLHCGVENVIEMLMIYSTSPHGRRLAKDLMTKDPFHVDVTLDNFSRNRNAEILNAYFKTLGLKLVFTRRKKVHKQPMKFKPMGFKDRAYPMRFKNSKGQYKDKSIVELIGPRIQRPMLYLPMRFKD